MTEGSEFMPLQEIPDVPSITAFGLSMNPKRKTGFSEPLSMQCCKNGAIKFESYIVKLYNDVGINKKEFGQKGLAKEIFGGLLGYTFGLNVPEIAIVSIPAELYETSAIPDTAIRQKLSKSPGKNFGSKEIITKNEYAGFIKNENLNNAAEVFAFDAIIGNNDRKKSNPNLFMVPEGFVIYDHEKAFEFANPYMLVGEGPIKIWGTQKGESLRALKEHLFYPELKGKKDKIDLTNFTSNLSEINVQLLSRIVEKIPEEWHSEELENINTHLLEAASKAKIIEQKLMEVLS